MLEFTSNGQADQTSYPDHGVKIGITYHEQTLGKHRPRFVLERPVFDILRRGLSYPRCHIDGDFVNGMRIWCSDEGGLALTGSNTGPMSFTLPARRVRGREQVIHAMKVSIQWERDETGPVLLIPRVPDELLPEPVLDKLPNSQVDASTIMARAEKRLQRESQEVRAEAADERFRAAKDVAEAQERFRKLLGQTDEATIVPEPEEVSTPTPEPATIPGEVLQPPSAPAVDLKEAIAMVNELVDQLGDEVVLSIDATGHVQAKRRIVQYIDL